MKLLTDTVAAESVVLAATAANPKTNDILFILCILLQIAMGRYDTTTLPHWQHSHPRRLIEGYHILIRQAPPLPLRENT